MVDHPSAWHSGPMAATIRDVAREAQVSVASVSRALNGAANVRPATRDRIAAVAAALGYVPHAGARSLSTAKSHAIGVVLPDLHGEFFSELVRGIDREASARGYHLLLSNIHADAGLAAQAIRAMRGLVDALVVMAPQIDAETLAGVLPDLQPAVLVNSHAVPGRTALRVHNAAGAATVTRHLVERGRRHIVHIAGPADNIDAAEREAGYRAALGDLPVHVVRGDFQEEGGEAAVRALIAAATPLDAIFAANDQMAFGALAALREAGIAVPDAVAVAGFDDVPLARHLGLTTIRIDIARMGERAAALVLDAVQGLPADPAAIHLPATLIVRTTA
jgi:LacI family transcriptional regulator